MHREEIAKEDGCKYTIDTADGRTLHMVCEEYPPPADGSPPLATMSDIALFRVPDLETYIEEEKVELWAELEQMVYDRWNWSHNFV